MSILPEQLMTEQLAEFTLVTKYKDLPQEVVHTAKRLLLDSIGCIVDATVASERGKAATAPLVGQHTDEILSRFIGLSEGELSTLRAQGVIK